MATVTGANAQWRTLCPEVWAVYEAAQQARAHLSSATACGFAALETGHHYGDRLGGVLFMDFTVAPPEDYIEWGLRVEESGNPDANYAYPDKETAMGRFRLIPEQPGVAPELLEHMANYGLKEVEMDGPEIDPALFDYLEMGVDQQQSIDMRCLQRYAG